jgi:hypothetical protein
MADPSPDKPDQPAAAEGRKPEDAAERLNEILSSPIEDPFGPGAKPAGVPETKPAAVPPDFAGWQGAQASPPPQGGPAAASAPQAEPAAASPTDGGGVIAKVRQLMLISTVLTALAIAAVFAIIGYRVFKSAGSQDAPTQATLTLPPGAKIVQTAIAQDRLVFTLEIGGAREIRTYDLKTLKPLGRLNFGSVP